MLIKVMYHNNKYDMVNGYLLDKLLASDRIKRFYRYSEKGWVIIGRDWIRGRGGTYSGHERRTSQSRKKIL